MIHCPILSSSSFVHFIWHLHGTLHDYLNFCSHLWYLTFLFVLHSMLKWRLHYRYFYFCFHLPTSFYLPVSQHLYFSLGNLSTRWYLVCSFIWMCLNNDLIFHSSNILLHSFVQMMYQWWLKSYHIFSLWFFVFFGFHFDCCDCS